MMMVDDSNLLGHFLTNYKEVFVGLLLRSVPTIVFFLAFPRYLTKGQIMRMRK